MRVHAILSKLFKKHPMLLSGIVIDNNDTHQAFEDAKASVEADAICSVIFNTILIRLRGMCTPC